MTERTKTTQSEKKSARIFRRRKCKRRGEKLPGDAKKKGAVKLGWQRSVRPKDGRQGGISETPSAGCCGEGASEALEWGPGEHEGGAEIARNPGQKGNRERRKEGLDLQGKTNLSQRRRRKNKAKRPKIVEGGGVCQSAREGQTLGGKRTRRRATQTKWARAKTINLRQKAKEQRLSEKTPQAKKPACNADAFKQRRDGGSRGGRKGKPRSGILIKSSYSWH